MCNKMSDNELYKPVLKHMRHKLITNALNSIKRTEVLERCIQPLRDVAKFSKTEHLTLLAEELNNYAGQYHNSDIDCLGNSPRNASLIRNVLFNIDENVFRCILAILEPTIERYNALIE